MIDGYLRAQGGNIVNGSGETVLLKGWGLGNWLLQEGYMWYVFGNRRFDRPRRIEAVVEELTGKEYAHRFWKRFRKNYVTREDILRMAQLGYNSVRIPFCYRLFLEEGPGIVWKEEGFELLDRCIDWCGEAGIYAFLDLHGAPGGQTGANIDDCIDDVPRLFLDREQWDRGIALWARLAERYKDNVVVGGYDLLNEPIAPPSQEAGDHEFLIPRLKEFYQEATAAIRKVDRHHLLSIEGAHWATDLRIFDHRYDDNMVLHFHRYGTYPDYACLEPYVEKAKELDVPLWLGETGENVDEWYTALCPLAESLGIGYNLWPWKKMACTNSPYSVNLPNDYSLIMDYIDRGPHPGYRKAQEIFDEYLENIKLENCQENAAVIRHVLRRIPFSLRATDFDQCPGKGRAFSGTAKEDDTINYRGGCGMRLVELEKPSGEKRPGFDCGWDRYGLLLEAGEYACYQVEIPGPTALTISLAPRERPALLQISDRAGREEYGTIRAEKDSDSISLPLSGNQKGIRITAKEGTVCLVRLSFSQA